MPKVTRQERYRRDGILSDLGCGDYEPGRVAFRRLAVDHGLRLQPDFDAYSPAASLLAVYDMALDLVRAGHDAPDGSTGLFIDHMPNFTDDVKADVAGLVEEAGISWCALDLDPFPFWTTPQWYERIRGYGIVLDDFLTAPLPEYKLTQFGDLQVLLVRRDRLVYGWVGIGGYGFIDRFHLDRPLPRLDSKFRAAAVAPNVRRLVLGCAFAWSIDLRVHGEDGPPGLLNMAVEGAGGRLRVFEAGESFRAEVAATRAAGSQLIAAHWRCAHLREGNASDQKILAAPPHFQRHVGDGWTWVEGHPVSDGVRLTIERLSRRTSIADAVGMAFPKLRTVA